MQTRKKYILAKQESTYGTDPTPAAANAILTTGLQRKIYDGPTVERQLDRADLGSNPLINTAPMASVQFGVELAGTGTLGTAPGYGPILRAMGFAETVTASTKVEYDPISDSYESVAIYYDRDSERQILLGGRGTGSLVLNSGQIPLLNAQLSFLYATPANQTLVTPSYSQQDPIPVNYANTTTCTLDSYDLELSQFSLDFGWNVPHLNLVNYEEILLTNRAMTGTMVILAPHISTKDLFALVESHSSQSTSAFQLIHAATPDIVQLDAPQIQLTTLDETDLDGEQAYSVGFRLIPTSAGDDELKITFK